MGIPPNSISSVFLPQRQDLEYLSPPMQIFVCVLSPPDEGYIAVFLVYLVPNQGDRCYQYG